MGPSSYSRLQLALALLLTACSTTTPLLQPTDLTLSPGAAGLILTATSASTEAVSATRVAPGRTVVPTNTLAPVPLATATVQSPADTAVPPAAPSMTITVTMNNYRFDPSILRVRAGETIRLDLRNPDNIPHAIAVPDARFSELLRPGATRVVDFVVDLPPGSYYLVCPVQEEGNHEELGMVGTLIVEAAP